MTKRRQRRLFPGLVAVVLGAGAIRESSWTEPPRFDGAGYATLGRSLAEGRGYREINRPDAPLHAHFPPAYPATLAILWRLVGTDDPVRFIGLAHAASVGFLMLGGWAVARWWATVESRDLAAGLALALALNWTWVRTGGVIRSEPLAIALGGLILLSARRLAARGQPGLGVEVLSGLLGLAVLTRQVNICWGLAVAVDLAIRFGWRTSVRLLGGVMVVVVPWVGWQVWVGSGSQSGLFRAAGWLRLVGEQSLFYARRIPDVVFGPGIEVATVFHRLPALGYLATAGGLVASSIVVLGWVRLARSSRRRLGGLIPLFTLPLLLVWPFTEAGRFLIPLVPFVVMGAVEGGAALLGRFSVRRARLWACRLILCGSIPYTLYIVGMDRAGAERRTHREFDAACAWVAAQFLPIGPVMARHPGDVAWLSGRQTVAIPEGAPTEIAAAIRRWRVAFLIVDEARYARSPKNPLRSFVTANPRVRRVWDGEATSVYQVLDPDAGQAQP